MHITFRFFLSNDKGRYSVSYAPSCAGMKSSKTYDDGFTGYAVGALRYAGEKMIHSGNTRVQHEIYNYQLVNYFVYGWYGTGCDCMVIKLSL